MSVMPDILTYSTASTGQVQRLAAGTSATNVGPALGVSEGTGAGQAVGFCDNRLAVLGNGSWVLASAPSANFHPKRVFTYDPATNAYVTQIAEFFGNAGTSGTPFVGGVHVLAGANGQVACGFNVPGGAFVGIKSWTWNGTTFAQSGLYSGIGPNISVGRSIKYRNLIYQFTSTGVIAVDPINQTLTSYTPAGWTATNPIGTWCVFRDRLFCLRFPDTSQPCTLYELSGGNFVSRGTMAGAGSGTTFTMFSEANHALFAVGNTKMVAVYLSSDGTNHGTRACDITPTGPSTFSFTNLPDLIPASLEPQPTASFQSHCWNVYIDNDTNPGSPVAFLFHCTTMWSGTPGTRSFYEYVSSAAELAPGTASVPSSNTLVYDPVGGGERINFDSTLPDTDFQARLTSSPLGILGGVRLSFTVKGNTSGGGGRRTDVNLATAAALPAYTASLGPGPGRTFTADANGALTVDGTAVSIGQRILNKDDPTPANNGIFTVSDPGSGGTPWVLVRATDFDQATPTEVAAGAWTRVLSGNTQALTYWQLSQTAAITVDTTALTFTQIPQTLFARVYYNTQGNVDLSQGTLQGTATGLPWVVRNVNVIEGIIADNATVYTLDWNIPAGPTTFVVRIGTS